MSQPLIRSRLLRKTAGLGVLMAIALIAAVWPSAVAADAPRPSFLNSREIRSADLARFHKWNAALTRYAAERSAADSRCHGSAADCQYGKWLAFLDGLRGSDKHHQLVAVNGFVNAKRYVADASNWGVTDYWASPGEFFARSGDCEDFAIAKFLSLKALGWTDDELRIVAVKDLKLGIGHAVLVAFEGGRTWVLDNQTKDVVEVETLRHYQPVFSINETAWWLHQAEPRT
jgi:predicted transglutaminase-like cysteine proteinase